MPEFIKLLSPQEALFRLIDQLEPSSIFEEVEVKKSLGRVTGKPILAPHSLPSFPRTTVDGYAVRSADTHGAGETLPAYLEVIGEVKMGTEADFSVDPAQCALIHTGGMLPPGSDSVVMLEHTQIIRNGEVEISKAVAVGENIINIGEDVVQGEEIIPARIRIQAAEIGGLMALGVTSISVVHPPIVGIISSGDEVVPPEADINIGEVRDINSYTLSALISKSGGMPIRYGIVPDKLTMMLDVARRASEECDMIVITAGSSASTRDLTAQVIDKLGKPGVLVHGVNVRPGKPTILGICRGKPVIGLPGNPVSALVIASLFVVPVIEQLLGLKHKKPQPSVLARLSVNISSSAGREDWIPVRLISSTEGYVAEPIFGKSNLIFTLVNADGLVRIPADATGLDRYQLVDVYIM